MVLFLFFALFIMINFLLILIPYSLILPTSSGVVRALYVLDLITVN